MYYSVCVYIYIYIFSFFSPSKRSLSADIPWLGGRAKADEFWINLAITQVRRPVGTKGKFQRKEPNKLQIDDLGSW